MNNPARPGRPPAVTAGRALASIVVSAAVAMAGVVFTAGAAQAAITSFIVSPQSGAPGTVAHVSGTGCAPGLLSSPSTDFVSVSATTLGVAFQAPVASNGSWQGSFTVPANALPVPAAVLALCTSGGLPSLFTIYTPQTFSVSAATASTTLPLPPTTVPVSVAVPTLPTLPTVPPPPSINPDPPTTPATPTTAPRSGGGGGGGSSGGPKPTTRPPGSVPGTKGTVPGTIAIGAPGDVALPAAGGSPSATAADSGSRTVSALGARPAGRAGSKVLPADLGTASLAADSVPSPGGLGWLVWALLAAVVGAGVGTPALLRSRRRRGIAEPAGEPM